MEQEKEDRFVILRREVLETKELSSSEKLVYARICGFKKYFESADECAALLGVSRETVVKAKQKLLRLNFVQEIGNTGHGKIYQAVYDECGRLVKSTRQTSKKQLGRLVKSTTIEERQSKDRVKALSVDNGETQEKYGNSNINELFEYWSITIGIPIRSKVQRNRNSCNTLIKQHGLDGVKKLIQGARLAMDDRYAPSISDFISLQSKQNELIMWGHKKEKRNAIPIF